MLRCLEHRSLSPADTGAGLQKEAVELQVISNFAFSLSECAPVGALGWPFEGRVALRSRPATGPAAHPQPQAARLECGAGATAFQVARGLGFGAPKSGAAGGEALRTPTARGWWTWSSHSAGPQSSRRCAQGSSCWPRRCHGWMSPRAGRRRVCGDGRRRSTTGCGENGGMPGAVARNRKEPNEI